jgi:hypothetical protein
MWISPVGDWSLLVVLAGPAGPVKNRGMDDPEHPRPAQGPLVTAPDHHLLLVPVTSSRAGTLALRTGNLASGQRTGLAFTSEAALLAALGPGQGWVRLSESALRSLLSPLGVDQIRLDPLAARSRSGQVAADPAWTSAARARASSARRPARGPARLADDLVKMRSAVARRQHQVVPARKLVSGRRTG